MKCSGRPGRIDDGACDDLVNRMVGGRIAVPVGEKYFGEVLGSLIKQLYFRKGLCLLFKF